MSLEKDGRIENQRDISYINDLRTKTKRSINEAFSNKQIKKSTLINENDLSLINKVLILYSYLIKIFHFIKIFKKNRFEVLFSRILAIYKVFNYFIKSYFNLISSENEARLTI